MSKNAVNDQLKVLSKLFDAGYVAEKDISSITLDKILEISGITVTEISLINELQKAVKANKVISFLSGTLE